MAVTKEYLVEPHPKGLGFIGIETRNGRVTWRSQNHCDEEFCWLEIEGRKKRLEALSASVNRKYKWGVRI